MRSFLVVLSVIFVEDMLVLMALRGHFVSWYQHLGMSGLRVHVFKCCFVLSISFASLLLFSEKHPVDRRICTLIEWIP